MATAHHFTRYAHQTDSLAINALRRDYRLEQLRREGPKRASATPLRLGMFAGAHRITITDFGAHSQRWIDLFKQGYRDTSRCHLSIVKA